MRSKDLRTLSGPKEKTGGSSKLLWFVLIAVAAVGVGYLFVRIQLMMTKSRFDEALGYKVMDTTQYAKVTVAGVRARIEAAAQEAKVNPDRIKSYISLQTKDDFNERGRYDLERQSVQGFRNAQSRRSKGVPGCSVADALPPGTTTKDLAGSSKGGMTNRIEGLMSRDAKAVVTGKKSRADAPAGSIILALDVLLSYKVGIFRYKLWFHRRCYFYQGRRAYEPGNEHDGLLKSED